MEAITKLSQIDAWSIFLGILIIISAIVSTVTLLSKFSEIIGKPFKWVQSKNKDHELLITTSESLIALQKKQANDVDESIRHDKEIKEELEKLTRMFIDKEIDDMRWEILDFASALSSDRRYSKEQFDHVFQIHQKYSDILEANHMENGQVTTSMEVIHEIYKEKLKKGF